MTGKELLLVLAIAATASGATGALIVASNHSGAAPDTMGKADLDNRFDRIEAALEKTAEAIQRSDRRMTDVSERLASVEYEAGEASNAMRELQHAAPGGMRLGTGSQWNSDEGRPFPAHGLPEGMEDEVKSKLTDVMKRLGDLGADGKGLTIDSDALRGRISGLSGRFQGMRAGMELRKLPEEERWAKAQEDVGLSWNQVEDLKRATAERDEAMKEALVVDRDAGDGDSRITIKRLDPAKAAEANTSYQQTVDNTLNDDQKKSWKAKGYDHAFGRGGSAFGGPATMSVITIGSSRDRSGSSQSEGGDK